MMGKTAFLHLQSTVLRGGRMTKWKGVAASIAPVTGALVAPVALGVALSTGLALPASATCSTAGTSLSASSTTGIDQTFVGSVFGNPYGIFLSNTVSGGITLTGTGVVTGGFRGILAQNSGTLGVRVVADAVVCGIARDGVYARNSGTFLELELTEVTGGTAGIGARNTGSGALSITASGTVIGNGGDGIFAVQAGDGLSVTVVDVTGTLAGLNLAHTGTSDLSISAAGTVTGGIGSAGIYARTTAAGDALTVAVEAVTGGFRGIDTSHLGSGDLTITARGNVVGGADGIQTGKRGAGDSILRTYGSVEGNRGIGAGHFGSGDLSITAQGQVTGRAGVGIQALVALTGGGITVSAVDVSGSTTGIDLRGRGNGPVRVTTTGSVEGTSGSGVQVTAYANATGLYLSHADVTGGTRGISATHAGSGDMSITATGSVVGGTEEGVYARTDAGGGALVIDVADVDGGSDGIEARHIGTGDLAITASGAVTGTTGDGVTATTQGTDLALDLASVTGGAAGINARNEGSGDLSLTTSGMVSGGTGDGIYAFGRVGAVSVEAAGVSGGIDGIDARSEGAGAISITTSGAVTGGQIGIQTRDEGGGGISVTATGAVTGTVRDGVSAQTDGGDVTLDLARVTGGTMGVRALITGGTGAMSITTGDVITGALSAIEAENFGPGAVTITASGELRGNAISGVVARATSGDLTLDLNTVTGYFFGIDATGGRGMTITASGPVTATAPLSTGIRAFNVISGTGLTIDVGEVTGGADGISAVADGTGPVSITATGTVTGSTSTGVNVRAFGGDVTVDVATVIGGNRDGIRAETSNSGDLTVRASGAITAGATSAAGLWARSTSGAITIDVAAVTGGNRGISSLGYGAGPVSITATGPVRATGATSDGLYAIIGTLGSSLTIDAGAVSGVRGGIVARSNGSGAVSITSSGAISGDSGRGIYAANAGTDLTLTLAGDVTGGTDGIEARNTGSGAMAITATGRLTSGTGDGITADNATGTTDMTIAVADVIAGNEGIRARNEGTGDLEIRVSGTVVADDNGINATNRSGGELRVTAGGAVTSGFIGIGAINGPGGGAMEVSAAAVTARGTAIGATQLGTGSLALSASGNVSSTTDIGVFADTATTGTSLSVDVQGVASNTYGIFARGNGTGAVTVRAAGPVSATINDGILATARGTDLTLALSGPVTGGRNGVIAANDGSGAVSVTASGTITGGTATGLYAYTAGTDLTLSVAGVSGGATGIRAFNGGSGALGLATTGGVVTSAGTGIAAVTVGTDLTLALAGDVTAGGTAIQASNTGSGALTVSIGGSVSGAAGGMRLLAANPAGFDVTVSGALTAGSGAAIRTDAASRGGRITVTGAGTLGAAGIVALEDLADGSAGAAASTLDVAGTIAGRVVMGAGSDRVILRAGARQGGGLTLDGDAGGVFAAGDIDRLTLAGWAGALDTGQIANWEEVQLTNGAEVVFTDRMVPGRGLANANAAGGLRVTLAEASVARFLDSLRIAGSIAAQTGQIDLSGPSPAAGTILTIDGDFLGASRLTLDVVLGGDASPADRLVVGGATAGITPLWINTLGGSGAATMAGILLVDVAGPSAGSFQLANPDLVLPGGAAALLAGAFAYTLEQVGGDWVLRSRPGPATAVYEALPLAFLAHGTATTLQQRLVGRLPAGDGSGGAPAVTLSSRGEGARHLLGPWINFAGGRMEVTPATSATGLRFEQDTRRIEAGVDMILTEGAAGRWIGSMSLFQGDAQLQVRAPTGGGVIDSEALGIALGATWYGDGGHYADLRLDYARLSADLGSQVLGSLARDVGGEGFGASIEIGQSFAAAPGLTLTPQAQVIWSRALIDDFTGAAGLRASSGEAESLRLRLGLAAERTWTHGTGRETRAYGLADLTRELAGDGVLVLDRLPLISTAPDLTAGVGLGAAHVWRMGQGTGQVFAELAATRGLGSGSVSGMSASIGFRLSW